MGVRFECPAGHKLHVKAELAGKRGICPECGAKFIVPNFSGERVAEDNGAATAATVAGNASASPAKISRATPPPSAKAPAPPAPPAEPTAWYIRPAGGGQFGPASDEVFAQWIAEGRVSADSWVWRNGWVDWKAGGEALSEYGVRAPAGPALAMAAAVETSPPSAVKAGPTIVTTAKHASTPAAHVDASTAEVRRAEIKRRKQKARTFSIVLGLVAIVMLVALVFVLTRNNPTAPAAEEKSPAEAPKEAPNDEPASE